MSMPVSMTPTLTREPSALTPAPAPPPAPQAVKALMSVRSGSMACGVYSPSYCACFTMGADAIVLKGVPFSCTATAFRAISNSPVTLAAGAFCLSHCLKSLRSAFSCARYDFTALPLKSIFLPGAGLVLTYVDSGSPLSWTIALLVSMPADAVEPSVALPPASPVLTPTASKAATTNMATALNLFRVTSPLLLSEDGPRDRHLTGHSVGGLEGREPDRMKGARA